MKSRWVILIAVLTAIILVSPSSAWLAGWGARQKHDITGSSTWGQNLTNYSVPFTVHYGAGVSSGVDIYLDSLGATDFDDLRFTDLADTNYDYWIEDKVDSSLAHVWVEIPTVGDTETTKLYVYYGNAGAAAASNGENTFSDEFFDHFDEPAAALNTTTLWYTSGTGSISVSSSIVNLTRTSSWAAIYTQDQFPVNYSTRFNGKINVGATGTFGSIGWAGSGGTISEWYASGPGGGFGNTRCLYTYQAAGEYREDTTYTGDYQDIDIHRNSTTNDVIYRNDVYTNASITQVLSGNANGTVYSGNTAGGYGYADWFLIRKYNYPEPAHSTWYAAETNAPVAEFSGTPRTGMDSQAVVFTDLSTNTPTSWYWEFGDGDHAHDQNPTHNYLTPGVYQVSLQATNAFGSDWENKTGYVEIWAHGGGSGLPTTSYLYSTEIELTGSDKNLIGYEIPIQVTRTSGSSTGSTLYVNTAVASDYRDIKFFQDGYVCDYWIEQQTSTCATVWINVPFIKKSTDGYSYLYAYFGNMSDTDTSNGTDTFMFFDDFESGQLLNSTGGKWTYHPGETENWTINSSMVYDGSYSASGHNWGVQDNPGRQLKIEYLDWSGASYEPTGNPEMKNVTIESRMRWTSTGSATCHGGDLYSSVWDGLAGTSVYSPYYIMNSGNIVYHNVAFLNWPNSLGTYTINTWHKVKLTRDFENGHQYAWIDSQYLGTVVPTLGDGTAIDDTFTVYWTGVVAASTFANPLTTDQYTYVDDFFIHQYYYPEPSITGYVEGGGGSPTAAFTANTTSGTEPLVVQFTDTSATSGTISSWLWDFNNDGSTDSTSQNPVCNYTTAGLYSVNLTITDEYGTDSEVKLNYISVGSSLYPEAQFTANITYGTAPLTVQFTDLSSNSPSAWKWNVTSGAAGVDYTSQNPTHTFTEAGSYSINLTASNAWGSDTLIRLNYVTVVNSTTSTGAGAYYASHDVRWTAKRSNGVTLPYLHVTATPTNTSYGSWSWINDLLGISPSVDVKNTTLEGMTGTDGSITFVMIPEVEYTMHFYNSTQGIDHTIRTFPKDTDYIIIIATSADVNLTPMSSCVNWTRYSGASGGTATIGALFTDSCGTTSNVSVLSFYSNGTYMSGHSHTSPGTSLNNVTHTFSYSSGTSYKWALTLNGTYGNETYWFSFTAPVTPVTTEVPAWALQWGAIGFLICLAAIFSISSVKFGVILVPVFAGVFAFLGWINVGAALIPTLITIGALMYMRQQEARVQ